MKPVYQRCPDADVLRLSFNPKFPFILRSDQSNAALFVSKQVLFLIASKLLLFSLPGIRSVLHAHPLLCSSLWFLLTVSFNLIICREICSREHRGLKAPSFMLFVFHMCGLGQIELIACEKWFINKTTHANQPRNLSLLIDMQFSQ